MWCPEDQTQICGMPGQHPPTQQEPLLSSTHIFCDLISLGWWVPLPWLHYLSASQLQGRRGSLLQIHGIWGFFLTLSFLNLMSLTLTVNLQSKTLGQWIQDPDQIELRPKYTRDSFNNDWSKQKKTIHDFLFLINITSCPLSWGELREKKIHFPPGAVNVLLKK